jgi:hypothetical protein
MGNGRGEIRVGLLPDTGEAQEFEPTDQVTLVGSKRQRVTDYHPQHRHETQCKDALHEGSKDVLSPHHPPIEECKPGCHEHH